jgi:hypothetical protein
VVLHALGSPGLPGALPAFMPSAGIGSPGPAPLDGGGGGGGAPHTVSAWEPCGQASATGTHWSEQPGIGGQSAPSQGVGCGSQPASPGLGGVLVVQSGPPWQGGGGGGGCTPPPPVPIPPCVPPLAVPVPPCAPPPQIHCGAVPSGQATAVPPPAAVPPPTPTVVVPLFELMQPASLAPVRRTTAESETRA